jgi:HKD family nuclease
MELITNKEIKQELVKQINSADEIYISVAWATMSHDVSQLLLANKSKIEGAVIGTHFYQTDPEFIKCFNRTKNVGFIKQTSGVFHPKVYLFKHKDCWQLIVGSANLTSAAMGKNDEINLKVSAALDDTNVVQPYLKILQNFQSKSSDFTEGELAAYTKLYKVNQRKVNSLAGDFGGQKKKKPELDSSIITRSWKEHVSLVKDDLHGIEQRVALIEFIQEGFREHSDFYDMSEGLRRTIAGLPTEHHKHWGWFGSMRGAGRYFNRINNNNEHVSSALSHIPLVGEIEEADYFKFIEEFKLAFPDGGDGIAVASRLLAMKRPDIFVCIDARNKRELCIDFGIAQSRVNYDSYWFEVIGRIQASAWWQSDEPTNAEELGIYNGRAALLDCIFYDE